MTHPLQARTFPIFAAAALMLGACKGGPASGVDRAEGPDQAGDHHEPEGGDDSHGPPVISRFFAAPASINPGDPTTLSWKVEAAARIVIDHGVGDVTAKRQVVVRPAVSTTYTLIASNPDGVGTARTTVAVAAPGPQHAVQLSVVVQPNAAVAGAPFSIAVSALGAGGQVVPGYLGTIHFASDDPAAQLPANYTFTAADAGKHSFTATLRTAGSHTVTAADTATPAIQGASRSVAVSAAAAAQLLLTALGPGATAGVPLPVRVTLLDAYGNLATGYTGTVRFSSSDGQAVLPADTQFTAADAGAHSFSVTFRTIGSQTITAADTVTQALAATSGAVMVGPAAAQTLAVSTAATASAAGAAVAYTVTVKDALGNPSTGYTGTVHFSSSDAQASLPADYRFLGSDAGAHTFSVTLKTAGAQTVTAADTATPALAGTSPGVLVSGGAAARLSLSSIAGATTAGVPVPVSVTVFDAYNNVATGYAGKVHFSSSDASAALPGDHVFASADAGQHAFAVAFATTGPQTITVADAAIPSLRATSNSSAVSAAAASKLVLSTLSSPAVAGQAIPLGVTAHDAFGNVATSYRGTVHFTLTDGAAPPADYAFTSGDAGAHSFNITFLAAGLQSASATDVGNPALAATSNQVTVDAGPSDHVLVTATASSVAAGSVLTVAATVQDANNNTVKTYAGTVHLSSSDARAVLPADYSYAAGDAGTHSFSVTFLTAGSQTVTVADTATQTLTGTSGPVTVTSPAPVAGFTATGSLSTARYAQTATLLPGGKVLVTGGWRDVASAELYDPAAGTFTATGSLLQGRSSHTATLLSSGKVLIAGGQGTAGYLATAELYDPVAGTFTATGSLTTARGSHTATLLPGGQVLLVGGYGTGYLATAELYDPAAGTFTATGSLQLGPRSSHTATPLPSGKVLIGGGVKSSVDITVEIASAELYDPAAGTFAATGSLGTGRGSHMATLLPGGKVLFTGGYARSGFSTLPLASAELYDPVAGTFAATGSLATARYSGTATLLRGGKVLVAGGFGPSSVLASAELYDPVAGTFAATGNLLSARDSHTATLLSGGSVLVAGGIGVLGSSLATAELY